MALVHRTRHLLVLAISVLLLLAVRPAGLLAQVGATTDLLTGVVSDSSGRPISDATVEALSLETQITRRVQTDRRGRYTIVFPDGGGQYRMTARMIGMAPRSTTLQRQADEDRLVWNIALGTSVVQLEAVNIRSRTPVRTFDPPTPGSTERAISPDAVARLPIDASDLAALASLVPGVVSVGGTDTSAAAFSVAGQRADANAVTLDGLLFGSGSVPQDAVRTTRVVTSTYDVARGQFSGGLVASTTRSGTNVIQGTGNYSLRDDTLTLDGGDSPFTSGFTQNQLSAGLGGPVRKDRLFVFGSAQAQLRRDAQPSLLDGTATDFERLGVSPDSVARLLSILQAEGIPSATGIYPDSRKNNSYSALLRFDYLLANSHTLTLRGDWRGSSQDPSRVGSLSLPQTGGTLDTDGGGGMLTLTSRFGVHFVNEARAYLSSSNRDGAAFTLLPEGRVQVASDLDDGSRGVSTLTFGGSSGYPLRSRSSGLETSDELSWLPGSGTHRIKLGMLYNTQKSSDLASNNQLGSFRFNSLAGLEAGTPASFSRTVAPLARDATGLSYAAYLADTWRVTRAFQLTYGVRGEGSSFRNPPIYNPAVGMSFGVRTDRLPSETHLSPRAGFTWTLGQAEGAPPRWTLRGGGGEFRSAMPLSLASVAQASTGLTTSEAQFVCVGSGSPTPDWTAYMANPGSIPDECVTGGPTIASSAPNAVVFAKDFSAPRSWRTSLGAQRTLTPLIRLSVDASYARGVNQTGFADLNLNTTPAFGLSNESGRPVFVTANQIDPASGAVGFTASRIDPAFGQVVQAGSNLSSDSKQVTASLGGITRKGIIFQTSYTYARARDQLSSSGFGTSGFGAATTAGNPNIAEWARSDLERRHSFLTTLTYPIGRSVEITTIARLTSGTPFTPRVGSDINGDGQRNDRAFIFSPAAAPTAAVGDAISRLLEAAPGRLRDCLTAQFGSVAGRNSCVGPWQGSLDLQLNYRPTILGLRRQLMISVVTVNLLRGIDDLVHGSGGAHGWGLNTRPDPTLLYVNGFDAATNNFSYAVNERFGATSGTTTAIRSPFQIGVQARLTIGPDRTRQALEGLRRGAPGAGGLAGQLASRLPNPADSVLAMRDSLGLTADQQAALKHLADSVRKDHEALVTLIQNEVTKAGPSPDPARLFAALRPQLQAVQTGAVKALAQVQAVLTPEQWARVPERIRVPRRGGPGGPGGQGGPGGGFGGDGGGRPF
ncbi:MAG: carboxypeptidase regulatory-like domain-containing protein [Gemmatimonadales bacterium]|nr:carboxypeptidase regulatory-like domain-containing protein [Gemmatimonadales bacterium]